MNAKIWTRRSLSEQKLPRLSNWRTRILSQISTWFIKAGMLRRVIEHHLMGRIMQKSRSTFHRLEHTTFAFDSQRLCRDASSLSHSTHQRVGWMDSEIVEHDGPLRGFRVIGDQAL